jgi:hypothetical protein
LISGVMTGVTAGAIVGFIGAAMLIAGLGLGFAAAFFLAGFFFFASLRAGFLFFAAFLVDFFFAAFFLDDFFFATRFLDDFFFAFFADFFFAAFFFAAMVMLLSMLDRVSRVQAPSGPGSHCQTFGLSIEQDW